MPRFGSASMTGRLERVRSAPTVFLDAAHNPHGAKALAAALAAEFDFRKLVGVVSVMADKDVRGLLEALEPVFDEIVVTHNGSPRAMDVDDLADLAVARFGDERVVTAATLPDAIETAIKIQLAGLPNRAGGARMRGFSMHESDMENFVKQPWVATSTDAGSALPDGPPSTHARFYGSFPRKIRHYAIERGAISIEHAIRSSTSLPALIMGLDDRGLIREGMAADLVVLDLATIRDKATFFEPHQYSEGIEHVFVNGVAVVDGSKLTWALPGRVITR